MHRHFATLFDQNYMPQGVALYESILRHSSESFTLHVLTLDHETWQTLKRLKLKHVELIPIDSFEWEMGLREIRQNRTHREWCWSLASHLLLYLLPESRPVKYPDMQKRSLPECTYLDSDLFFYADPAPVFKTIGSRSIAITPHQFPDNSEKARLSQNGLFNVGWVSLKNTPVGRACVTKWAAQVRERCSETVGCGDQIYLDVWSSDFGDEVCILGHGINAGPWNLMGYPVTERDGYVYLGADRLVCYHAHEYRHNERLTNYPLRPEDIELVYSPYIEAVQAAQERIGVLQPV